MPWEGKTVEKLRLEFCELVESTGNISKACREFNITRKTGYKWLNRDNKFDLSRKPLHSPCKTSSIIEDHILKVRYDNPAWGGKKIHQVLINEGHIDLPCIKTINNILKRNDCITKDASEAATPYKRFQRDFSNDLWQSDFKGDFLLGNKTRCYPLDIIDDHSRYCLKLIAKSNQRDVKSVFKEAFIEYGMPNAILTDNGSTFRGSRGGISRFEKWLIDHDVLPIHGKSFHPQTQGKIERFHKTMKAEILTNCVYKNISDIEKTFDEWQYKYNYVRPHEAIGLKCPGEIYKKSNKEYLDKVEEYDYTGYHHIIKVNVKGYVKFNKFNVYLSESLAQQYIEIRSNVDKEIFSAYYRNYKIAEFDSIEGCVLNRSIRKEAGK